MIEVIVKCQSCIERGFNPPNNSIGTWSGMPICDTCLTPLVENKGEAFTENCISPLTDPESFESRKEKALEFCDSLDEFVTSFPLKYEETLKSHDDFYNYRAIANVSLSIEDLAKIIERRKTILFQLHKRQEADTVRINKLKADARKANGLTSGEDDVRVVGTGKSILEKKKPVSKNKEDQEKKLAKALGISVEEVRKMGASARQTEFGSLLDGKIQDTREVKEVSETTKILNSLKKETEVKKTVTIQTKVSRCEVCKKLTCIC